MRLVPFAQSICSETPPLARPVRRRGRRRISNLSTTFAKASSTVTDQRLYDFTTQSFNKFVNNVGRTVPNRERQVPSDHWPALRQFTRESPTTQVTSTTDLARPPRLVLPALPAPPSRHSAPRLLVPTGTVRQPTQQASSSQSRNWCSASSRNAANNCRPRHSVANVAKKMPTTSSMTR